MNGLDSINTNSSDFISKIQGSYGNFRERIEKEYQDMHPLSIINIGKSGVGKSVIINAVFGKDLARTGIGRPVTQHCESYTIPNSPVIIYDSKGLETSGEANAAILDELKNKIKERNSSRDTKEYIHICWYCVLDDGNRLDAYEIERINEIRKSIPVVIVITQAVGGKKTDAFVSAIRKDFAGDSIDIIPIMALPKTEQSEYGEINIKSHGLDKLVERSHALLPDSVQRTFAAFQTKSMELKKRSAFVSCTLCSGSVAAAAFQPFPVADAPIMIAIQVYMMALITVNFGIKPSDFNFKTILSGLGGPFAAAAVGRTLVSLIKIIPGVGTAVGGVINAATGAVLTFAIGSIYINVLARLLEKNGKITEDELMEELKKEAKNVNMDEMKKSWEKAKNNYSKEEAEEIAKKAREDVEKGK